MANFKGSIQAVLGLDSEQFDSKIGKSEKSVSQFRKTVTRVGGAIAAAFSVGALVNFTRNIIQSGSRLTDLAQQVGINVEAFQALNFAAREAGVKQESLTRALRNVRDRGIGAAEGMGSYEAAFEKLNIDIERFNKLPAEKKLEAVAIAARRSKERGIDPYSSIMDIIGEQSGPELQEVLDRLATDGFANLEKSARDAGQVLDEDVAKGLDKTADRIENAKKQLEVEFSPAVLLAVKVLDSLVKALKFLGDMLGLQLKTINDFKKAILDLVNGAIQSFISQITAAMFAVKGLAQALTLDFTAAKKSFDKVLEEQGKVFSELGRGADLASSRIKRSFNSSAEVISKRYEGLRKDLNEIWSGVAEDQEDTDKEAADRRRKRNELRRKEEEKRRKEEEKRREKAEKKRIKEEEKRLKAINKIKDAQKEARQISNDAAFDELTTEQQLDQLRERKLQLQQESRNNVEAAIANSDEFADLIVRIAETEQELEDQRKERHENEMERKREAIQAEEERIRKKLESEKARIDAGDFNENEREVMRSSEFSRRASSFRSQNPEFRGTREDIAKILLKELRQQQAASAFEDFKQSQSTESPAPKSPADSSKNQDTKSLKRDIKPDSIKKQIDEQRKQVNTQVEIMSEIRDTLSKLDSAL